MKTHHHERKLTVLILLLLTPFALVYGRPQAPETSSVKLTEITIVRAAEGIVVQVVGSGPLEYHADVLANPARLVLDFTNVRMATKQSLFPSALSPVRQVRVGQFKPDTARVVIDLEREVQYTVKHLDQGVSVAFAAASVSSGQAVDAHSQDRMQRPTPVTTSASANPSPKTGSPDSSNSGVAIKSSFGAPSTISGGQPAAIPLQPASAPTASAPPEAENTYLGDAVDNGMLTLRAQGRSLQSIVREIGQLAGVSVILPNDLANEQVSVEFHRSRVDEALRQMLANYDTLFLYGKENEKSGGLRTLWIYAPGKGPAAARFSLATWKTDLDETKPVSSQADPELRASAVQSKIRREGRDSLNTLMEALQDPSGKVREKALNQALVMGVAPSEDMLIALTLNDDAPAVRLRAFQALPVDPTMRWIAERAMNDSNAEISMAARDFLREFDRAEGRSDSQTSAEAKP